MLKRSFLLCLLCGIFTVSNLVAQDAPPGNSGTQISSIGKYNETVNEAIARGDLFVHRVTLNSSLGIKIWGNLSKYEETLNCYFEIRDGLVILKKVIIDGQIADRRTYADYLFDEQGNLTLAMISNNVLDTNAKPSRHYYLGKQLIGLTQDDITYEAADFTTEMVNEGIEILNKGVNYKKMFDALIRVQLNPLLAGAK